MDINYVVIVPEGPGIDLMFGIQTKFYGFIEFDEAVEFGKENDGSRMAIVNIATRDENGEWIL